MGDVAQTSVILNGVFEASLSQNASVSIGAGVGFDAVDIETPFFSDDDIRAAVQMKVGLALAVDESIDVIANYRLMYAYKDEFSDIENRTLTIGLRIAF